MTRWVAISAHRGGRERFPLATWEAYRSAAATGAEYVEFDVRRLGDGELVCFHDPHAHPDGPLLRELSYRELCDLAGYEVPTVAGVMAEIAGKAAGHVDLKEAGYEDEVVTLALDRLGPDGFVVTTLEDTSIQRITREFPGVRTALTLGRDRKEIAPLRWLATRQRELFPVRRVRATGADWVAMNRELDGWGVLDRCARHRIGVMVWTVDEVDQIDRYLADPRVTVLVTNRPGYAVERRAKIARDPGRG